MDKKEILVYDCTLRDGTQGGGMSLSVSDKVQIAKRLDDLKFDYIEGGWPGSNPKDIDFFDTMKSVPLRYSKLAAFGSTRKKDTQPEQDSNLQLLVEAATPAVTIFMGSYLEHVTGDYPDQQDRLMKGLDVFLERDRDLELFDLPPNKEISDGNPS